MSDAILAKGMSRPIDMTPTPNSPNLVTSGGVKAALDIIAKEASPEIYIGKVQPISGETVWFDTSVVTTSTNPVVADNYVLLETAALYVDATNGSDETGNGSQDLPYHTISAAINAVPKNLNGNDVTINIATATYNEDVEISGFNGGKVILAGEDAEISVAKLDLTNNTLISIEGLTVNTASIYESNSVLHTDSNINITSDGAATGIELCDVSAFYTEDDVTVTVKDTGIAIKACKLSKAYIDTLAGSNNIDGIVAESGSAITVGTVELVANVLYSTASGATISVDAQTNLSSY